MLIITPDNYENRINLFKNEVKVYWNCTNCFDNNLGNITHLIFGWEYNQPMIIPNSVTQITFGLAYNQPTTIPNSITDLFFWS